MGQDEYPGYEIVDLGPRKKVKKTFIVEQRYVREPHPTTLHSLSELFASLREWHTKSKYASLHDAEKAVERLNRVENQGKYRGWEYRLATVEEES